MTKVTDFNPNGLPLPLGGWSTGYSSIGSNTDSNPPLSALNFVQRITANTSNTLLNPIVNFASGSGVSLAAASNTITISATGGGGGGSGTTLPWFDVTAVAYGATGNGVTDDTAAVQAAINACMTAGGGTVYFPPGIYQISGALQNTSTHNSQLVIPTAATPKAIRFLGFGPNKLYGGTPSTGNESVIRSDWNGSISGHPAIISAGTYHGISESLLYATFENLTIVAPDDPKLSALAFTAAQATRIKDVQIRTTSAVPSSLPTHSNAVGLEGPWGLASIVPDYAIGLDVYGFYTGIVPAEQFHGVDIGVAFAVQAMLFIGGQTSPTYTHYPVVIDKLVFTLCTHGLVFTTDTRWVHISSMSVEHDAAPFAAVYDIDDASNYAEGFIDYQVIDFTNGVGTAYPLLVNGGTKLSLHWATGKQWTLNSTVAIPTGTDPSTNPATGGKLYAASATGHPTWRDSSGTVTDLLSSYTLTIKDEGSSLATGATSIDFVGSGVTASGTTAAKTVTITSGIGEILISDTPSTPLVFADLIQNEAQTDLVYADPT